MSDGVVTQNRNNEELGNTSVPNPSMNSSRGTGNIPNIDMETLGAIVREVIRRLTETNDTGSHVITDRVVTATTIESLRGKASTVIVELNAIVTPAAKDAASDYGIEILRGSPQSETKPITPSQSNDSEANNPLQLSDTNDPSRGKLVAAQLQKRNVTDSKTRIVLSDSPALTVVEEIQRGEVAVMVSSLDHVQRFDTECSPTTWVLDMKQLNLPAAVNVAAQIVKLGNRTR